MDVWLSNGVPVLSPASIMCSTSVKREQKVKRKNRESGVDELTQKNRKCWGNNTGIMQHHVRVKFCKQLMVNFTNGMTLYHIPCYYN
jgi:hypothetical protein